MVFSQQELAELAIKGSSLGSTHQKPDLVNHEMGLGSTNVRTVQQRRIA